MKSGQGSRGVSSVVGCALVAGAQLLTAQPASAVDNGPSQTGAICMQKVFGTPVSNANALNCTANDIRISRATSVSPDTCILGTRFALTATFETIVTANSRYDAGFFFRIDGGPNARGNGSSATGECSLSALTIPPPPNPPALNLDGDTCGDLNSGTYSVTFTIPGVLCQDSDNDGVLNLPNCTSWHSNQGTPCTVANAFDFDPDTKSKCVCDDNFEVPVQVEQVEISVDKSAAPTQVPEPGGTVTFTVQITNPAVVESVTIDSIVDDVYGDLGGANPNVTDNTCPTLIDSVLGPGASASCEFKALVSGDAGGRETDTVEVCAVQPNSNNELTCDEDDADVDVTDVWTQPTLTKTAQASANCQLDVTYQVVVSNNSEFDTLTVNSLNDDRFGNVATAHAAGGGFDQVVSTTCTLPQPPIASLGNFTCTFVGRIASSSCDIDHANTVTGGVTDDDGVPATPSDGAAVTVSTTP